MLKVPNRKSIVNTDRKISINSFGGMDISSSSTTIPFVNSPDIKNMIPNSRGDLDSRPGWALVKAFDGPVNGVINYLSGEHLVAAGTHIYSSNNFNVSLYTTVNAEHEGFIQNGNLYLQNGSKYLVYDGTTITEVVGYVPTVTIATPPTGGGTAFEERNYISKSYKQSFTNDGTNLTFQLLDTTIDADLVLAQVLNLATGAYDVKVETTDFTVNRTTGLVTFITAPPNSASADGNDTVILEPTKDLGQRAIIEGCTTHAIYGGGTNLSVWITGNPTYKNYDYHSQAKSNLMDPTYFPINNFDIIGFNDQKIVSYEHYYDRLVIYKEDESWIRETSIVNGVVTFNKYLLNAQSGCKAKNSTVLVNNFPWCITKKGLGKTYPYEQQSEKNVEIVSDTINYNRNLNFSTVTGLLESTGISRMNAIDYEDRLWISDPASSQVWVCDYNHVIQDSTTGKMLPQFYRFTNILSERFAEVNGSLLFGTAEGNLCRIKARTESGAYLDNTDTIDCYHTMKLTDFESPEVTDNIPEVFITFLGYLSTHIDIYTRSNNNEIFQLRKTESIQSFSYSELTYSSFIYGGSLFPKTFRVKVKMKNNNYSQLKIGGNYGEPLTLVNVELLINSGKDVR